MPESYHRAPPTARCAMMRPHSMVLVEAVFFGGVFGAAGVFMLTMALRHLRRRGEIARWPRAEGTVLGHDVLVSGRQVRQRLRVRYHVGPRTFVHLVDSPTGAGRQRDSHDSRFADPPPVGAKLTLYVHPDHGVPTYRVLPEAMSIIALATGGVLFLGVTAVAIAAAL